jgi:hypothetical protein
MSDSKEIGKHTPGSWYWDFNRDGGFSLRSEVEGEPIMDERNCPLIEDRVLIAAAPDLLGALEYLMRIVDSSGDERYVQVQLTPEFFEPARAAIARARGLSQ